MEQGFLGTGWAYGLADQATGIGVDGDHRIAEASGEDLVRQAIWLVLSTAIGERVARPDFGCAIHDLVFAPLSAGTMGEAIHAVREALVAWEPRIDVLDVDAYAGDEGDLAPGEDAGSALIVEVHYRIRATNSQFNLVYPFYLST